MKISVTDREMSVTRGQVLQTDRERFVMTCWKRGKNGRDIGIGVIATVVQEKFGRGMEIGVTHGQGKADRGMEIGVTHGQGKVGRDMEIAVTDRKGKGGRNM
jgi:hypothetical protein